MSHPPSQHTFVEPKPGSDKALIKEMYDTLIARMRKSLDNYAADPRRNRNGSVYLHFGDGNGYFQETGKSSFAVRPCDTRSMSGVIGYLDRIGLLGNPIHFDEPLVDSLTRLREKGTFYQVGFDLRVEHDIFPQGHTDHNFSMGEVWGAKDYDPTRWGHRHEIDFGVLLLVENDLTGQRDLHARHLQLKSRFDRDPIQLHHWRATNPIHGFAYPRSTDHPTLKVGATRKTDRHSGPNRDQPEPIYVDWKDFPMTPSEVVGHFGMIIGALKNLRPLVHNPDELKKRFDADAEMIRSIFHPEREGSEMGGPVVELSPLETVTRELVLTGA